MTTLLRNIEDFSALRQDFPILHETNRGRPLIYFDTASSAQKPKQVVDAIAHFYFHDYANIHRGIYELSERASALYEATREQVRRFINADQTTEIIFVRGATEGINLVAACLRERLQAGDEIILSEMEHHSNIVPWYLLKEHVGISLKVIPVTDDGLIDMAAFKALFSERTKLLAINHVSHVLGTINPVKEMTAYAHEQGVQVLVDGAQAAAHLAIDVADIDCDFYVFSGHKMYGPSGVGVLYGKSARLQSFPPYQGGGGMIESVTFSKITFAKSPQRFEAGTPNIAGVVGLGSALKYIESVGLPQIHAHERDLMHYMQTRLAEISGLRIIGTAPAKVGVFSFVMDGLHPHDIGTVLDHEGIAVRASHHCAMPLMERFAVPATVRASLGIYNHERDVDALIAGIQLAKKVLS